MIITLFLLLVALFLWRPAQVQSFDHQFLLENNSIDLDFSKIETDTSSLVDDSQINNILAFTYKIKLKDSVPADLPLFIVVFNKQIIFFADREMINEDVNEIEIDVAEFLTKNPNKWPIFYKNNVIKDFDLEVTNISLRNAFSTDRTSTKIHDLNAIRERDGSLTIIFNLEETNKSVHSYKLFCLDEKEEVVSSIPLKQENNFLWPSYSFSNLLANQKNELIFNLSKFDCAGKLYVLGDDQFISNQTLIVQVEDL